VTNNIVAKIGTKIVQLQVKKWKATFVDRVYTLFLIAQRYNDGLRSRMTRKIKKNTNLFALNETHKHHNDIRICRNDWGLHYATDIPIKALKV
jgi:hypothetical protein